MAQSCARFCRGPQPSAWKLELGSGYAHQAPVKALLAPWGNFTWRFGWSVGSKQTSQRWPRKICFKSFTLYGIWPFIPIKWKIFHFWRRDEVFEKMRREISLIPQPENVWPSASKGHFMKSTRLVITDICGARCSRLTFLHHFRTGFAFRSTQCWSSVSSIDFESRR